ncbi:hypothetical protein SISSUDRAFT_1118389 [Sistotremastrum suecicum HHB10207 ss-3]|uniref:Fungal STAND N-terminal Goodbye domain-containing protein n=1 Tax=Sistotremastrum suecicum HHB10207 ss-3 TaxID=1314776 RepID=A0A166F6L8_9AGAM|nr:hypothetical protein SISSUDRAFT_1118389 [Sistotremastrum suecicum HHB10207 ss-3]
MNNLRDRRGNNSKFNGLMLVLQSIKDSADAFPPLKSTAAALLVAIGICKDFKKNREDWFAFAQDLTQFMVDVNECIQKSPHPVVLNRLKEFTQELNEIFGEIVQMLSRSKAERFMQVKSDRERLENYQIRIREKRDQLHTILLLQISETVQEALNLAAVDHSSEEATQPLRLLYHEGTQNFKLCLSTQGQPNPCKRPCSLRGDRGLGMLSPVALVPVRVVVLFWVIVILSQP